MTGEGVESRHGSGSFLGQAVGVQRRFLGGSWVPAFSIAVLMPPKGVARVSVSSSVQWAAAPLSPLEG